MLRERLHASVPPSRWSNPFATCWTAPDALEYDADVGVDPRMVVDRLAANGWRGRLVGPHGAGKTALLAAIREELDRRGRRSIAWSAPARGTPQAAADAVLLVEGFERLSLVARAVRLLAWRAAGVGFVLTTHPGQWGMRVASVADLRPSERTAARLFERVVEQRETPVDPDDALRAFRRRRGDLRGMWFDLYDLHERRTRSGRTASVLESYV